MSQNTILGAAENFSLGIREELSGLSLPDKRLVERGRKVGEMMERDPSFSFPEMAGSDAELEAVYRFFNNSRVSHRALLEPHIRKTVSRVCRFKEVLCIHDTTDCEHAHADPHEIGFLPTGKAGFLAHISLMVGADATHLQQPLGVVALQTIHRPQQSKGLGRNLSGSEYAKMQDRESKRWLEGVQLAEQRVCKRTEVIHVQDREGDSYDFLASMQVKGFRFVTRLSQQNRRATAPGEKMTSSVRELVANADVVLEREVPLSTRKKKTTPRSQQTHPPRKHRLARLAFSATSMEFHRPRYLHDPLPASIKVNVIHVYELQAPEGQKPVQWLLVTTEPVQTVKDIERVVDIYRTRWLIEEFNKTLKSGCKLEARELEEREACLNVLALCVPIACRLLWMRGFARTEPEAPAERMITPTEIEVLRHFAKRPLSNHPTAREVLWAIAGLGGHLQRNGEPGWMTLWRGIKKLTYFVQGWSAALKALERPVPQSFKITKS